MDTTRDLWMELVSPSALVIFMEYKGETVRTLAAKAIVRDPKTRKYRILSPATIGHLRSGRRRTCEPATAKAIETALQAPPGLLFTPRTNSRAAAA